MKKLLLVSSCVMLTLSAVPVLGAKTVPDVKEAASQVSNEPLVGSMQQAMKEFKELSSKEKRHRLREVKKEIKMFQERKKAGEDVSTNTLLLVLLAILVPPLAVYLHEGELNTKFWISVILTVLGFVLFGSFGAIFLGSLLGIIYALIVVLGS